LHVPHHFRTGIWARAADADQMMRDVLAATPDDADPAALALALIGAAVLLLERAGGRCDG